MRALILLLPALLVAGCDRQQANTAQPAATAPAAPSAASTGTKIDRSQAGSAMPADTFTAPDGRTVRLADFTGRPLLVNLWATWCAPCIKEMPSLDRLAAREGERLKVLVVSQDSDKVTPDPVPGWWAQAGLEKLEQYRDGQQNLGFAFGGGMLPTTVLYDAQGREVLRVMGGMEWDGPEAAALVAEAL